jgi:hypothetical protein
MRPPPLSLLDALVEERIQSAIARGELDGLPGAGRPLELGDDALVPPEVRAAYRVLKNAGYAPPEVAARADVARLEALLPRIAAGDARRKLVVKIALLRARLSAPADTRAARGRARA